MMDIPVKQPEDRGTWNLCIFTICLSIASIPIYLILRRLALGSRRRLERSSSKVQPEPYETLTNYRPRQSSKYAQAKPHTREKLVQVEEGRDEPDNFPPQNREHLIEEPKEIPPQDQKPLLKEKPVPVLSQKKEKAPPTIVPLKTIPEKEPEILPTVPEAQPEAPAKEIPIEEPKNPAPLPLSPEPKASPKLTISDPTPKPLQYKATSNPPGGQPVHYQVNPIQDLISPTAPTPPLQYNTGKVEEGAGNNESKTPSPAPNASNTHGSSGSPP